MSVLHFCAALDFFTHFRLAPVGAHRFRVSIAIQRTAAGGEFAKIERYCPRWPHQRKRARVQAPRGRYDRMQLSEREPRADGVKF
jgi:hypothetical protein